MHLRNGNYFNAGPWKFGASANALASAAPASQATPGTLLNFWAGAATVIGGASIANRYGLPTGYSQGSAWVMAIKAGGLSAKLNRITGSGGVRGTLRQAVAMTAHLSGSGGITSAPLVLVAKMSATLVGSGGIVGAGMTGRIGLSATLTGSGGIVGADLSGKARMAATIGGGGGVTGANLSGVAHMSATITVTGTGLSTANVGEAVLAALVEAGFDLKRMIRIIAAATAGKNGTTALKFRDLSDTEDMIDGTFSGGKRTGATYGG